MHIYLAAPLFAQSDVQFNNYLLNELRTRFPKLTIYAPQENEAINDKSAYADSQMIAKADTEEVLRSDLLLALLDGPTIDNGVASEIGVAYAKGIPVFGLYTDVRQQGATLEQKLAALQTVGENQFHYLNLYTVGLIKLNGEIYASVDALISAIEKFLINGGTTSC